MSRSLNRYCLTAFLLLAVSATAPTNCQAQWLEFMDDFRKPLESQREPFEERIETERHDFTQSATTVGRGVVQIESGYTYYYKDAEGELENAHTTPELLLRYGLSEDIEFRVRWNYAWQFIDEEEDRIGSEDLRYSLKFQLTRGCHCGLLPTTAVEVRGSAPTGGDEFTMRRVEFSLDYIYQWHLAEGIALTGSSGFGTQGFGEFGLVPQESADDRYTAITQSVDLGIELTEQNTMYTEWYGIFSRGLENEFTVSVFNIGVDHYFTDNLVGDFRVGMGLTDDSDDFFAGIGGGYRF